MRFTRRPGRPSKAPELDLKLLRYGGLRSYVEELVAADVPDALICDQIERETGIRIGRSTLKGYRRTWEREADGKEALAV